MWNGLDSNIKLCSSLNIFKKVFKDKLIENYKKNIKGICFHIVIIIAYNKMYTYILKMTYILTY